MTKLRQLNDACARTGVRLIIAAVAAIGLAAGPGQAAARSSGYAASLATPVTQPKQAIVGGVLWKCVDDRCTTADSSSRPLMVCQRVVKAFGPVASFSGPAGELSADDLGRCNATQ